MNILNEILEFLYGWINSSWMTYLSFVLAILSLFVGGIGIFINKKYKKKIGILITVVSVLFFAYTLGIPLYNPGLVTGKFTKDDIVYSNMKKDYIEDKLTFSLSDLQFVLTDSVNNSNNCINLTTEIKDIKDKIEIFELEHIETKNIYREYRVIDNRIVLNRKVLNGEYKLHLKLKDYEEIHHSIVLTSKNLITENTDAPNGWWQGVPLTKLKSSAFENFKVRLLDQNYSPLVNYPYSIGLEKNYQHGGLYTNENGFIKYEFSGRIGKSFYINLEYPANSNTKYSKKITFEEKNQTIDVIFDNSDSDKLIANGEIVDEEYKKEIEKNKSELSSNIPNDETLQPLYYIGIGDLLYECNTMNSSLSRSINISECQLELFDVELDFTFDTDDKNFIISIPTGAGLNFTTSNNKSNFKLSKGKYSIEVYDKSTNILTFIHDIEVNESGAFSINYKQ